MDPDLVILECQELMDKAVDHLRHELRGVRTGRANAGLIEYVKVECYGSATDLKNIAAISVQDGTQLVVKPFDPGTVSDIVKGIEKAGLGLNPQSDGKSIRVPVPALSTDRRKQLAIQVKNMGEQAKVSIRNARRDANKQIDVAEKDKSVSLSEDMAKRLKDDIQEMTKNAEAEVERLTAAKAAEIMDI